MGKTQVSVLSDSMFRFCLACSLLRYTSGWQIERKFTEILQKTEKIYISFFGYLTTIFCCIFSHAKFRQFCYEDIQHANLDPPKSLPFIMFIKLFWLLFQLLHVSVCNVFPISTCTGKKRKRQISQDNFCTWYCS